MTHERKSLPPKHILKITIQSDYCQKWITEIIAATLSRWGWNVHFENGTVTGSMEG